MWTGLALTVFVIPMQAVVGSPEAPWWVVVLIGVGAGAGGGVLAWALTTYHLRRLRPVAGGHLSEQQFDEALRASWFGRVPADPWARDAAIRIVVHQLAQHRSQRAPLLVLFAIVVVANLVSWISGNWTGLLQAALFAVLMVLLVREPSRLGKILVRLRAPSPI